MDPNTLRKLIADARTERAVDELFQFATDKGLDELRDAVNLLAAKYKKGKKSSMMGIITNAEWMQIEAQVGYALLQLAEELPTTKKDVRPKTVFISYNHADAEMARKLKAAFESAGIAVIIDEEAMAAGADIRGFIEDCILKSDVTFSIVSKNSLLSGWVAIETINTFYLSKFDQSKSFIAGFLDTCFMDDDFPLTAAEFLDGQIRELDTKIDKYRNANLNFTNLMVKRTRLFDLRNNLSTIVERLNTSLTMDLRDSNWTTSITKITQTIKDKK